jgi:anhydro-N-acetylmuramic acid kinase
MDATAKEAISFAMLASARIDGVPSNLPSATGAHRAALLGSITQV